MVPSGAGIAGAVVDNTAHQGNHLAKGKGGTLAATSKAVMLSGYGNHGATQFANWAKGYLAGGGSPEEDIELQGTTLRIRARDMDVGDGIARSATRTLSTNVVGAGLAMRARVDAAALGMEEDTATAWQRKTEREFRLWAESESCDADRQHDFAKLQRLALLTQLVSGDAIALLRHKERHGVPYGLCIKLLEADRVSTPGSYGQATIAETDDGHRIIDGVEIDSDGEILAYHVTNRHPLGWMQAKDITWQRIPAYGDKTGKRQVLHLMEAERPEQRRGVPLIAPIIKLIKSLSRYTEAELMAAVISSMLTLFIESEPDSVDDGGLDDAIDREEQVTDSEKLFELSSGAIVELGKGKKAHMINPPRVSDAFEHYVRSICTQIGAATEIPKEVLLKEFTASYSASRAALLEFWKTAKRWRAGFVSTFCQPIYERFLAEAIARGRIDAPGFFDDPGIAKAYSGAEWHGPSPGQIDPLKEIKAAAARVKLGVSTVEREAAETNGSDWQENAAQRKREIAALGQIDPNRIESPEEDEEDDDEGKGKKTDKDDDSEEA